MRPGLWQCAARTAWSAQLNAALLGCTHTPLPRSLSHKHTHAHWGGPSWRGSAVYAILRLLCGCHGAELIAPLNIVQDGRESGTIGMAPLSRAAQKSLLQMPLWKNGSLSALQTAGSWKSMIQSLMAWKLPWWWHGRCFVSIGSLWNLVCCHLSLITFSVSSIPPIPVPPFTLSQNLLLFNFQLTQLKQMKELEQEKDSLLAGLEVVERARDWYQDQIHNVTERQRQVGQSSHCTVSANTALWRNRYIACYILTFSWWHHEINL